MYVVAVQLLHRRLLLLLLLALVAFPWRRHPSVPADAQVTSALAL